MSFYSEIALEADGIIAEFGAVGILRGAGFDAYDPTTGGVSDTDAPIDRAVNAVVLDFDEQAIAGGLVQASDKRVLISATYAGPTPKIGDKFIWSDGTYTVWNAKNLAPAGESVMYELQVRR